MSHFKKTATTVALLAIPALASAQTDAWQVSTAVLPLPEPAQATATVMGYHAGELVKLRAGSGDFICLADRPGDSRFQAACYHESLAPYMARGRVLSGEGITGQASIQKRWEEIEAGTLEMPRQPSALYQLIGQNPDAVTAENTDGLNRLTVIYMAYATSEATGFPARPTDGVPWMMFSGKPTAHLMIAN